jgi:glycerophosphoryl diester phosphodiesterase
MPAAKGAPSKRPLLLGHRGARARKSVPENTLASFDQALADGCDGFEFDVRLTADGQGIVCHDARSGRIEIAKASARQCAGLPRLEDVLARYHKRAFLDIELKVAGLEKISIAGLKRHPPRQGVVVSSFLPEVLTALHNEGADIPLGLICETREQLLRWKQLPVTYVIPHQKLVRQELIREVNEFGKKMLVWTVNSIVQMERLREWGVDGIISDDTKLLARTLK